MNTQSNRGWTAVLVAAILLTLAGARVAPAQRTLVNFDYTDGYFPTASVAQGLDGNLYGTTEYGGASDACSYPGCGTVFKTTPAGTLTTLYSFCAQTNCTDGAYPYAGLVLGTDGNFYGTTLGGGATTDCNGAGCGTVFKITPSGVLTTLHSFCSQGYPYCTDGLSPYAGLIQATDGKFYGTTSEGGVNGGGTVFKITPTGKLTTLYSFCSQTDCTDGESPYAGLVQATDGNFYGTTSGIAGAPGTVFKMTPAGTLTTLHSFCSQGYPYCPDGAFPYAGLIQATDGNLYGTTESGGDGNFCLEYVSCGTVFRITTTGILKTLHAFCSQAGCTDGANPYAGLVQATSGNLYGTTYDYGDTGSCCGVIFGISPGGSFGATFSFDGTNGLDPLAGLLQATSGALYGTTNGGGANGDGTVFSLSVGLGPFVETLPTSGKAGATVIILGNKLTGTTSVTFNGTAATFTVKSSTEITTTVPTGATTGYVKVTTPSRTLTSNVKFRVP